MPNMNLMQDFTDIDAVALDQLRTAEQGEGGVKLPFPVLNIFVMNGDPKQKAAATACPMLYFGGWAADSTKLGELILAGHVPSDLDKWSAFEGAGDKGSWQGRASRTVTAAFIASRSRWLAQDGKAYGAHYDAAKGFRRQHVQWLGLLYISSKPWGYAVLTAKGFQAKNVADGIKDWSAAIAPHRAALNAQALPLSAFAITIGTAGPEPVFKAVGQAAQSKITPIGAVLPAALSAEAVAQRFITAPNMRLNNEKLAAAREWLAAWSGQGKADPTEPTDEPTDEPF